VKVVSSTITTVASARNLGVVIDSRLTMADHVAAVCRAGYYRLRQLRPTVKSLPACRRCKDTDSGVYFKPPGLLQRCSLWHHWHNAGEAAVGSECGGPATHTNWQTRTHYTSPETAPHCQPSAPCQPSNRLQAHGSVNVPNFTGSHVLARQV